MFAPTPSGSLSQRRLWSGEARGPSHAQKRAGSLLQTDCPRRAGDEHGCWGLDALREGKAPPCLHSASMSDPGGTRLDPRLSIVSVQLPLFTTDHSTSYWHQNDPVINLGSETHKPASLTHQLLSDPSAAVIGSSLCCRALWSVVSQPGVGLKTSACWRRCRMVECSQVKSNRKLSASVRSTITILETSSRRRSTGAGR